MLSIKSLHIRKSFLSNQIIPISFLAIFSTLSDYFASIAGTAIIGGKFSTMGVVVSGVLSPILSLQIFICDMFCGVSVYLRSVSISEGNKEKGARQIGMTLLIISVIGVLLAMLLMLFAEQYVDLYHLSNETRLEAIKYVRAMAFYPILNITSYFTYEFVFRLNERIAAYIIIFCCSGLMILMGMIFTTYFGIVGMALAVNIASTITTIIGGCVIYKHRAEIKFSFKFKKSEFIEIIKHGFSYSQDTFYSPVYSAIILMFIGKNFGESCMAVFTILICMTDLCAVFYGISYASENQLSVYLGERNNNGVNRILNICIKYQIALSVIVTALVLIFAEPIALYFGMEEQYHIETISAIKIYALSFTIYALVCYLSDFYTSCEKFAAVSCLIFSHTIIAGLGVTILLGSIFGNYGMYVGKALEAPIALVLTYFFIKKKYKINNLFAVEKNDMNIVTFEYLINQDNIIRTRDEIEETLRNRQISNDIVMEIMLLYEEICMAALERNKKKIYGECSLFFRDNTVEFIIRDDGKISDTSDANKSISSFRSYLISSMVSKISYVKHINASNTNRSSFKFPLSSEVDVQTN